MDAFVQGTKLINEVKDWVMLVGLIAFMIIFWEPIAQRLGWKKKETDDTQNEVNSERRNALQPVLSQLELMTNNHLDHVQKSLDGLHEKHDVVARTQDKLLYVLEDLKNNGIKCRKE